MDSATSRSLAVDSATFCTSSSSSNKVWPQELNGEVRGDMSTPNTEQSNSGSHGEVPHCAGEHQQEEECQSEETLAVPLPNTEDQEQEQDGARVTFVQEHLFVFRKFLLEECGRPSEHNDNAMAEQLPLIFPQASERIGALIPPTWRRSSAAVSSVIIAALYCALIYMHAFGASVKGFSDVQELQCRNYYWLGAETCGPDLGVNCLPFTTDWWAIRCPGQCAAYTAEQRTAGYNVGKDVVGTKQYRGDSLICAAAIHSGAISSAGGCALARKVRSFLI